MADRLRARRRASRCTSSWRRPRSCSRPAPTASATSRTPTSTRSRSACPARCRCSTARPSSWPCASGWRSTARCSACAFHRKNYFYPDMPKAYQISQYDEPLNVDGWLDLPDGSRVGIERAHLEEDTGKSTHVGGAGGRIHGSDALADRLQPRRRAARRDRQPPRHPHVRAGPPVRQRAARHPRGRRGVGRQDGGGLDARRRQRQRAPAGRAVRHALRDQERQLGALARPGHRVRGPPPDRPDRERRRRPPGDPALGRGRRPHAHAAHRRRTPTTTATSSSPTSCRSTRAPSGSRRVRAALPPLPAARRAALAAATGAAVDSEAVGGGGRPRPGRLRAGRRRRRRRRRPGRSCT